MKKRIVMLFIAIFAMVHMATAYAEDAENVSRSTQSGDWTSDYDLYMIECIDGVRIDSKEGEQFLEFFNERLEEITYSAKKENDTFSFGYYNACQYYNSEIIYSEFSKLVNRTNELIRSDTRLSGNTPIDFSELELNYVKIRVEKNRTDNDWLPQKQLHLLGSFTKIFQRSDLLIEQDVGPSAEQEHMRQAPNRSNTIDGSYHYNQSGSTGTRWWHNQLNNTNSLCNNSTASPHKGDGNNRYNSGFPWVPNLVRAEFYTDTGENENTTMLWYRYDASKLNNLSHDNNDTLEMEVWFRNAFNASVPYNERGRAFQLHKNGETYSTNQPHYYKDTTLCDTGDVCFCVGVDDVSDLEANHWYFWSMSSLKGTDAYNLPLDGCFRVSAQRGYRFSDVLSGAYGVFGEEHDPTKALGQLTGQWVSSSQNAWDLAWNDSWTFSFLNDPVS